METEKREEEREGEKSVGSLQSVGKKGLRIQQKGRPTEGDRAVFE